MQDVQKTSGDMYNMNLTQLQRILEENKPLYVNANLDDKELYNSIVIQCDELGHEAIVLLTRDQILKVASTIQAIDKLHGTKTMHWTGTGIKLENNKYIHIYERDLVYDMLSGYKNTIQSKKAVIGNDRPLSKPWTGDVKKEKLALAPTGIQSKGYYYNLI